MAVIEYEKPAVETTPETVEKKPEVEILLRAVYLLEEFGWCQDVCALDGLGEPVRYDDVNASRFCAVGAVFRAADDLGMSEARDMACWLLARDACCCFIPSWNDVYGRRKEDVVAAMRRAAAL